MLDTTIPSIRDRFDQKPSALVRICIDALRKALQRDDFIVDMSTYGDTSESCDSNEPEICMGCLATCAIQEITGVRFTPRNIHGITSRANAARLDRYSADVIESAINQLRHGYPDAIYRYCCVQDVTDLPALLEHNPEFDIFDQSLYEYRDLSIDQSAGFNSGLAKLEALATQLEAKGI